jgi:hypothetical protein
MNTPAPFPTPGPEPKKGLSIASLVLGILSVTCFSIFTGIPAIITGHMAQARIKREPGVYGGKSFAFAGLLMGYLSIGLLIFVIPFMAALLLPALARGKERAQTIQCVNQMKQISLAALIRAEDHNQQWPPNLLVLSNELASPKQLVCPGDRQHRPASDWSVAVVTEHVSYEFLTPNAKMADVSAQVVLRCPVHENTGLGDGSVIMGRSRRP